MVLDAAGALFGIGLAVVGFAVVVLVCVAVLRLLSVVLEGSEAEGGPDPGSETAGEDPPCQGGG